MSQIKLDIQLDYNVPVIFKPSSDSKALLISGMAIDEAVNTNMWQVLSAELDYFVRLVRMLKSS